MKISILLPYKENYSETYPGAVSIFINATLKSSKYKSNITIYGSTEYKNYLDKNYVNIELKKKFFQAKLNNTLIVLLKNKIKM